MSDSSEKSFDAMQKMNANKEHFIDRFLRDTGLRVEDCELCEQVIDGVIRMWIKRKDEAPAIAEVPPADLYINKLRPGEPHVLLMARDPKAPIAARHWADISEDTQPPDKIQQVRHTADAMEVWRASTQGSEQ